MICDPDGVGIMCQEGIERKMERPGKQEREKRTEERQKREEEGETLQHRKQK